MLQCVAFLVDVSSPLVLKETVLLQPQLPTLTSSPNIFYSFLEGALGLANPLNAFSFILAFCFHFLCKATLIPSKVPD